MAQLGRWDDNNTAKLDENSVAFGEPMVVTDANVSLFLMFILVRTQRERSDFAHALATGLRQ